MPIFDSINAYAFYGLKVPSTISSINLSQSINLKTIGSYAFSYVKTDKADGFSVQLPGGIEKIGDLAFDNSDVNDINNIRLLENVTFGVKVFQYCKKMGGISIPSKIVEIPDYTFQYCSNAKNLAIPSSVQKIGRQAFMGCKGVEELDLKTFAEVPN